MANPDILVRSSYILVTLLIIWISISSATISNTHRPTYPLHNPPCYFNPLCSCSKAVSDLGIVQCVGVPMPRIPPLINSSTVFMLHMNKNGLRYLEPYFLQATGLYSLEISNNLIYEIPDKAFIGLERSLWELKLRNNLLNKIPSRALRHLQKLRLLDLSGNDITSIKIDYFLGLENSLKILNLANNGIDSLASYTFTGLPLLETIDLTGNNLKEIDPAVFIEGMGKLAHLILTDNLLETIPYEALKPLIGLKTLDLKLNRIATLNNKRNHDHDQDQDQTNFRLPNIQLSLDLLRLDYNQIMHLPTLSFQYFGTVNKTYFNGNPLAHIDEDAFRPAKIRELSLHNCDLTQLSPAAFGGLESSLQFLDLSGNNITTFSHNLFNNFDSLQFLSLKENKISGLKPEEVFEGIQYSINHLDLSGGDNSAFALQSLKRMRNLRSLSLSKLSKSQLDPDDFIEFSVSLEELQIIGGNLKVIKDHAFKYVTGIKILDLSENRIDAIENDALSEIGHTLTHLRIAHGLAAEMNKLPANVFRTLTNLLFLDLSNNNLINIADTSFHFLKSIKRLKFQDNKLNELLKGTFQGDIHLDLQEIYLSFNNLQIIEQHTFVDLISLEQLHLDDNRIERLERRAFMNLNRLKVLNLRGNKISSISDETFQNIPELAYLDVAYNSMKTFDFNMFDQVGTLAMLKVNASRNKIRNLLHDGTSNRGEIGGTVHVNIKILDLSYNNITYISRSFFRPVELTLSHLYLSHNGLENATWDVFGNMPHLQWLDLSANRIIDVNFDTFRNTRKLQVLLLAHNNLEIISSDTFRSMSKLRVIDLSHNKFQSLSDGLFFGDGLEKLDVSHNYLNNIPFTSLSFGSASTLCDFDLSNNLITSINNQDFLSRLKLLRSLDLSRNKLMNLNQGNFATLISLTHLDLSHNIELLLPYDGRNFQGLEGSLFHLSLDNISLNSVPMLPLQNLHSLSLAHNMIPTLSQELAHNLGKLRYLNLAHNDLTAVPVVLNLLSKLRVLSLAYNPISRLTNSSLEKIAGRLHTFDIRGIFPYEFNSDTLREMSGLRTFKISVMNLPGFNIPLLLQNTKALQNLELEIETESNLSEEMAGLLPTKLRNIILNGKGLQIISNYALQGVRSPQLHIDFTNTSVTILTSEFFRNLGTATNISIDVTGNNFKTLENPSTGNIPDLPEKSFLTNLLLNDNMWTCNCDIGWVEIWLRKRRQYLCEDTDFNHDDNIGFEYNCYLTNDDLREAFCVNKGNNSLLEVLKTDIECGWSGSMSINIVAHYSTIITLLLIFLLI